MNLFDSEPSQPAARHYRRWGLESAALDLALQQSGLSLAAALDMAPHPVTFVHSFNIAGPESLSVVQDKLSAYPGLRFKVDWSAVWDADTVACLAMLGIVDIVDFKGHYSGVFQGPAPSAVGYEQVAVGLPGVWLEDPAWTEETAAVLEPHGHRVTWDAMLHRVEDIENLPFPPRCINIKPSRFGTVAELFRVYEYCQKTGIGDYHCIKITGVCEPLPGRPVPVQEVMIGRRTLAAAERTEGFERTLYRPIERTLHPY